MSGQSASLSLAEAKKMQERIQTSMNDNHQGPKGKGQGHPEICEKAAHQGK
jgi:hypothetical protein